MVLKSGMYDHKKPNMPRILECLFLSYRSRHLYFSLATFRIWLVPTRSDDVANVFDEILAEFTLTKI